MFLPFFLLIGFLAAPIAGQDENGEDAFEIRRDKSQENEGMEGFQMSTAMLEPEAAAGKTPTAPPVTKEEAETTKVILSLPEEAMAEDPFDSTSPTSPISPSSASSPDSPAEESVPTSTDSAPETSTTAEELLPTVSDENVEFIPPAGKVDSTENNEDPVASVADVWTTSTETAERRVLKEKSGEELAKKDLPEVETTTAVEKEEEEGPITILPVTTEETTTKASGEAEEEAPFDSSNLSGLFEADGSPKVEESAPAFPIAHMPPNEQEEHSAEFIEKEKGAIIMGVQTTRIIKPEELETTATTRRQETTVRQQETTVRQQETTVRQPEVTTTVATLQKMKDELKRPVFRTSSNILTPVTLKITSIEWLPDFGNSSSGKYRKLAEQVLPELATLLKNELGDNFQSVEIESFSKGSVVINAVLSSKEAIADPEQLATRLENTISINGGRVGGNTVDAMSVTVNGTPSRAYLDRVNASYSPISTSPLLIAAIIGVAAILLILVVGLICVVNNRRSQGGMKMSGLPSHVEDAPVRNHATPQLNLMSYVNSTRNNATTGPPRLDEREIS